MLVVDLSPSERFGTQRAPKRASPRGRARCCAFSAIKNNDRVGLILVDRQGRDARAAEEGREARDARHPRDPRLRAARVQPSAATNAARPALGAATDLKGALEALARVSRRRSVAFVVSDFFATGYERALALAAAKHDVIPVVLVDPRDDELPDVGPRDVRGSRDRRERSWSTRRDAARARALRARDARSSRERASSSSTSSGSTRSRSRTERIFVTPLRDLFARRARRIHR